MTKCASWHECVSKAITSVFSTVFQVILKYWTNCITNGFYMENDSVLLKTTIPYCVGNFPFACCMTSDVRKSNRDINLS